MLRQPQVMFKLGYHLSVIPHCGTFSHRLGTLALALLPQRKYGLAGGPYPELQKTRRIVRPPSIGALRFISNDLIVHVILVSIHTPGFPKQTACPDISNACPLVRYCIHRTTTSTRADEIPAVAQMPHRRNFR
jgi:hypothetical protein